MMIINVNILLMKVLKVCRENYKLGQEIREGERGEVESQGGRERGEGNVEKEEQWDEGGEK